MRRRFHLPRPKIAFETLEPRTLLSGDPISASAQSALLQGLNDFTTWTTALQQHAKLAANLPVISSPIGSQVHLPADLSANLVTPIQSYLDQMSAAGQPATIKGIAAALSPDGSHALGQFADGEFLLTLSTFELTEASSHALDLSSDAAGVNLALGQTTPIALKGVVDLNLTFGIDTGADGTGTTFFIQPLAAEPAITETLTGSVTGITGSATIGVAPTTITNGSASLAASVAVALTDPGNADGKGYITTAEFQSTSLDQFAATTATGTANVTLPIATSLIAGTQTLTLDWANDPTSAGSSNIASLAQGQWAALNTTTIAQVKAAVDLAPTLLASAAGTAALGQTLPLMGTALGRAFDFSALFGGAADALTGVTDLGQAARALGTALHSTVAFTLNATSGDLEFVLGASQDFSADVPVEVDQPVAGQTLSVGGTAHLSGTATAAVHLGIAFGDSTAAGIYVIPDSATSLSASFNLATAAPIALTAALGLLRLPAGSTTFRIGGKSKDGSVDPDQAATAAVTFRDPAGQGRITAATIAANANAILASTSFSGASEAAFTLTSADGGTRVPVAIDQDLSALAAAPTATGTNQMAALIASASSAGKTAAMPRTFAKVQPAAVTADDTPAPSDLLSSPVQVAQGLDDFLSSLGGDIANDIFDNALPLIGSGLGKAFDFLNSTASNILSDAKKDASTVSGVDAVEAFLQSELAPYLKQADGKTASTIGVEYDGVLLAPGATPPQSYSTVAFVLQLGGIAGGSSALDLDLPSLLSSTDAPTITASVIWGMTIAVGIDGTGTTPTPFVTPQTGLTLSGTTAVSGGLDGTLIGLTASLKVETTAPDGTKLNNGLTFNAGLDFGRAEISGNSLSNLAPPTITAPTGTVEFHLTGELGFGSGQIDETLPYFTATLETRTPYSLGGTPDIGLDDISMDLGDALQPVIDALDDVETYVGRIQPILDFLTTPIPVINDITEALNLGQATVATLLGLIDGDTSFGPAFNKVVGEIDDFSSALTAIEKVAKATYSIGSIDFGAVGTSGDPVADDLYDQVAGGITTDPVPSATPAVANRVTADDLGTTPLNSALAGVKQTLAGYGITAGILDPGTVLRLLLGQKGVDLVSVDLSTPSLQPGAATFTSPPIPFPAFPLIELSLGLGGSVSFGLGFGYDSTGLDEYRSQGDPDDLADGFYIDDNETYASLGLQLSLNALVADIAGLSLVLGNTFDLHFVDPAQTGKTRLDDLGNDLDLSGSVSLGIDLTLNLFVTDIDIPIVDVTLLNFDTGGSGDASEVFGTPDANGNLVLFAGPLAYLETPGGVGQYEDAEKDDADINEKLGLSGDQAVHPAEYYIEQFYDDNDNFTVDPVSAGVIKVTDNHNGDTQTISGVNKLIWDGGTTKDTGGGTPEFQIGVNKITVGNLLDENGNPIPVLLLGGEGNDNIAYNGDGNAEIDGDGGDDTLQGGYGDDIIYAGTHLSDDILGTEYAIPRPPPNGGNAPFTFDGQIYGAYDIGTALSAGTDPGVGLSQVVSSSTGEFFASYDGKPNTPGYDDASTDAVPRITAKINGGGGNNVIYGSDGNDVISAGTGDIRTLGPDGKPDQSGVGKASDTVYGGGGDDLIIGGRGQDDLYGGDGADVLVGGGGDDHLYGQGGNDILAGGDGNDVLFGDQPTAASPDPSFVDNGAAAGIVDQDPDGQNILFGDGTDLSQITTASFIDAADNQSVSNYQDLAYFLGTGFDEAKFQANFPAVTSNHPGDDLLVAGDQGDLIFTGDSADGSTKGDTVTGGAGDDIVVAGDPQTTGATQTKSGLVTIDAGGGDDLIDAAASAATTIVGGDGANRIYGSAYGTDRIWGSNTDGSGTKSANSLFGNVGDFVGFGDALNTASSGDATVYGGSLDDVIDATGKAQATLYGENGNDSITGTDGDDLIYGGAGDDVIYTRNGADDVEGDGGGDTILALDPKTGAEETGVKTIYGDDPVTGGDPNDGKDKITGGRGNDFLFGGAGDDTIYGGSGNDVIAGGSGDDDLSGGLNPAFAVLNSGSTDSDIIHGDLSDTVTVAEIKAMGTKDQPNDAAPSGIDTIVGSGGNDYLFGDGGDDVISGGAGSDTIYGDGGDDTIFGETGTFGATDAANVIAGDTASSNAEADGDDLFGGDGNDHIFGDIGNDVIVGGKGQDWLYGGAGNDIIHGDLSSTLTVAAITAMGTADQPNDTAPSDTDHIFGDSGDDDLFGDGGNDYIAGGADSDTIYGDAGIDTIHGDAGIGAVPGDAVDTVVLGDNADNAAEPGNDIIYGGTGNDFIFGDAGDDRIAGNDGNDTIAGDSGNDQIDGSDGNDTITGGPGYNVLSGDAGNDVVTGGDDGNLIEGGTGDDTLTGGAAADTIDTGAGNDQAYGLGGDDLIVGGAGVDHLDGGADNDRLYAGTGLGNTLDSGDGNDLIVGADVAGAPGQGDLIDGGAGNDTIYGLAGDDLITGGAGDDTIYGGTGNDTITGNAGNNTVYGQDGNDAIYGYDQTSLADNSAPQGADTGRNLIDGGAGDDTLYGGSGQDNLFGGPGADQLFGEGGDDVLTAGTGLGKALHGGTGDDVLYGATDAATTIDGDAGDDHIFGGPGNDIIDGGAGNDSIDGGAGDDTISGQTGADLLIGGAGSDTIYGQNAADAGDDNAADLIYGDLQTTTATATGSDSLYGDGGNDLIFGATGDRIDAGEGAGNLVSYGGSGIPGTYAAPTPAAPPALTPVPTTDPAAASTLPQNVVTSGKWLTLAGYAGGQLADGTVNDGSVAVGSNAGHSYVAWSDTRSGVSQIYVAELVGSDWMELAGIAGQGGISDATTGAIDPSLAFDANGRPIVAWTDEATDGSTDIKAARYDATASGGAGGWTALGTSLAAGGLSDTGEAGHAQILTIGNTEAVLWLDGSSGTTNVYAKSFDGTSWSALGANGASGSGVTASTLALDSFSAATDGTRIALAWAPPVTATTLAPQAYVLQYSGGT